MTATDELRRLLDERGVEWRERVWGGKHSVTTFWHARGVRWHYRENRFGEVRLHADGLTPEQAIDATLGRGTCHNAMPLLPSGMPYPDSWMCSECGGRMDGIILEAGNYCPFCGREMVDE